MYTAGDGLWWAERSQFSLKYGRSSSYYNYSTQTSTFTLEEVFKNTFSWPLFGCIHPGQGPSLQKRRQFRGCIVILEVVLPNWKCDIIHAVHMSYVTGKGLPLWWRKSIYGWDKSMQYNLSATCCTSCKEPKSYRSYRSHPEIPRGPYKCYGQAGREESESSWLLGGSW